MKKTVYTVQNPLKLAFRGLIHFLVSIVTEKGFEKLKKMEQKHWT